MTKGRNVFLIVGCQRSGTTLLSQALGNHPEVFVSPETKFFSRIWGQRRFLAFLPRSRRRKVLAECIQKSQYPADAGIFEKYADVIPRIMDAKVNYGEAFLQLLEAMSEGAQVIGEKTPLHTPLTHEILKMTGDSLKILAISRDAPAVTASLLGNRKFPRVNTIEQCAARWVLMNQAVLSLRSQLPASRFCLVRFEDLIESPETTIRRICRWLGIERNDAMLAPRWQNSSLPEQDRILHGLDASTLEKWRGLLTSDQIERICGLTASVAVELGYERTASQRQAATPFAFKAECALQRTALNLMRWGIYPKGALTV